MKHHQLNLQLGQNLLLFFYQTNLLLFLFLQGRHGEKAGGLREARAFLFIFFFYPPPFSYYLHLFHFFFFLFTDVNFTLPWFFYPKWVFFYTLCFFGSYCVGWYLASPGQNPTGFLVVDDRSVIITLPYLAFLQRRALCRQTAQSAARSAALWQRSAQRSAVAAQR